MFLKNHGVQHSALGICCTINDFLNTKRGKKADKTVKYYEERLREFTNYLEKHEQIADLQDI